MLKRLHRHILHSFAGPFFMALVTLSFILVSQFMVMYLRKITGTGIRPGNFLLLWVFTLGRVMVTVVPLAVLAAGVMTFGNLAERQELAASKSAGVSLWVLMKPLWLLSLVLLALMYYATFLLIPDANLRFQKIIYSLTETTPEMVFQPGYFHSEIDDYVIWITDKHPQNGTLYNIMVHDHSQDSTTAQVMMADSASAELIAGHSALKLTLYHGSRHENYTAMKGENSFMPYGRAYFDSLYIHLDLSSIQTQKFEHLRHRNTLRITQLAEAIDSLKREKNGRLQSYIRVLGQQNAVDSTYINSEKHALLPQSAKPIPYNGDKLFSTLSHTTQQELFKRFKISIQSNLEYLRIVKPQYEFNLRQIRKYEYEYYGRMASPLNVVFFMLIGLALGSLVRKGGLGVPALTATAVFVLYYFAISQGEKLTKVGVLEPWAGAWIPVWIFLGLAVGLTYLAIQESKWVGVIGGDLWDWRIPKILPFIKTNQQGRKQDQVTKHGNT